jgi:hypothetical protein
MENTTTDEGDEMDRNRAVEVEISELGSGMDNTDEHTRHRRY